MRVNEITKIADIKVGQKIQYKGESNPYPNTWYDGEVIGKTDRLITLRIKADQSTITDGTMSEATPYNRSITSWELGRTQHIYA